MLIITTTIAVNVSNNNCVDGDVRLVGGTLSNEGRVEICINRVWGTVCHGTSYWNYWDTTDARVICRQLGYQEHGKCVLVYTKTSMNDWGMHG